MYEVADFSLVCMDTCTGSTREIAIDSNPELLKTRVHESAKWASGPSGMYTRNAVDNHLLYEIRPHTTAIVDRKIA